MQGQVYHPGQGNNAYIFPGVGLGVLVSGATRVTHSMFHQAAMQLALSVPEEQLNKGSVYPRLSEIREVSIGIAAAVARVAYDLGLATEPEPDDLEGAIRAWVWKPEYESLLRD